MTQMTGRSAEMMIVQTGSRTTVAEDVVEEEDVGIVMIEDLVTMIATMSDPKRTVLRVRQLISSQKSKKEPSQKALRPMIRSVLARMMPARLLLPKRSM